MHHRSVTKQVFRLINESRALCIRIACAFDTGLTEDDRKQAVYNIVRTIAREVRTEHKLKGTMSLGSLRSSQFRFGKWRRIPNSERNVLSWQEQLVVEKTNPTYINPDEAKEQEKRARFRSRYGAQYDANIKFSNHGISKEQYDFADKELRATAKRMAEQIAKDKEAKFQEMLTVGFNKIEKRILCPSHMGDGLHLSAQCYASKGMYSPPKPKKEEFKMKIKTQTLVNGIVLDTMSDDALIDHISACEHQINTLSEVQTQSKYITKKVETLRANAKQLAGFLDARGS